MQGGDIYAVDCSLYIFRIFSSINLNYILELHLIHNTVRKKILSLEYGNESRSDNNRLAIIPSKNSTSSFNFVKFL